MIQGQKNRYVPLSEVEKNEFICLTDNLQNLQAEILTVNIPVLCTVDWNQALDNQGYLWPYITPHFYLEFARR